MIGIAMALLRKRIVDGAKAQGRTFATAEMTAIMGPLEQLRCCCALQSVSGAFRSDAGHKRAEAALGCTFDEVRAIECGFEDWDPYRAKTHPFHYALGRSLRPDAKESP